MSKIRKVIENPNAILRVAREKVIDRYIRVANSLKSSPHEVAHKSGMSEFDEILSIAERSSDIGDHLPTIFIEAYKRSPDLIVELGVRGGASTSALERAARLCDSMLVSVDIDEPTFESMYERRRFVREDDITFGNEFATWCNGAGIKPTIDVLFIDTSHEYGHTVQEIETWFRYLADNSIVLFHDTNMREVYHRNNGELRHGWGE